MRTLTGFALALVALTAAPGMAHPPVIESVQVFASGLLGPEGLAFEKGGGLIVGSAVGEVRRIGADGAATVIANLGEPLAGVTVLRDGSILIASFTGNRVWRVDPVTGATSVFAAPVPGANFVVESRRGHIFASASSSGEILDITGGTPVTRAAGLSFPNGLAIGRNRMLYVAELTAQRVSRLPILADGTLGSPEVFATGLVGADGIAFDRAENLLVVGADTLWLVDRAGTMSVLSTDPLLNWPSNIAFGRGHGFARRDFFLANFGFPLGSGTEVLRVRYNHRRERLVR